MNTGELELFATQELINELLRRTTFQGVNVHAVDGAKSRHWDGERLFAESNGNWGWIGLLGLAGLAGLLGRYRDGANRSGTNR